jgi:hypothetical protein
MWLFGSVLPVKLNQSHFDKYLDVLGNIFKIATGYGTVDADLSAVLACARQ